MDDYEDFIEMLIPEVNSFPETPDPSPKRRKEFPEMPEPSPKKRKKEHEKLDFATALEKSIYFKLL